MFLLLLLVTHCEYILLLLDNNSHVSDISLQEKKPANLQLLTSWEVVGVANDDIIII